MLLCASTLASAQSTEPESPAEIQVCVQQQVLRPEHRSRSVSDLYILCEQQLSSDSNNATIAAAPELNRFFRPYKDNYLVFGQARTADGSTPFSGEQLDISYRRPWVNSAFFISYYEGYGEALISFNQKTRSLRAGLYFPLEVLSR
jgi:hypothetical protein